MGEFVTDLDDSYTTEDYMDVPLPPPRRPPILQSRRATVPLPLRTHDSPAYEPTRGDVQFASTSTQTTQSFGFPVSVPPTPTSEKRRLRGQFVRKGSDKLRTPPVYPKHRPRPVATTSVQEVFHSITATPGLDERSFEVRPLKALFCSSSCSQAFAGAPL